MLKSWIRTKPRRAGLLFRQYRSFPLEGGLEQAELALDWISRLGVRGVGGRVHGRVEPADRRLQHLRPLDQETQALGYQLDVLLVAVLAAGELDLRFLLV